MEKVKRNLLLTLFAFMLAAVSAVALTVFSYARADEEVPSENIVCVFTADETGTVVSVKNLTGLTSIDWGDGSISTITNETVYSHTYENVGEYTAIFYDATTAENAAFKDCISLTNIVISDNVISLGRDAFANCSSLVSATLGNGIDAIKTSAFWYCEALENVVIGTNVEYIDDYAFNGCHSLGSVVISDSVIRLGNFVFNGCGSLESVLVKGNIDTYGSYCFKNCSSLESITLESENIPSTPNSAFLDINADCILYVPAELLEDYQADEYFGTAFGPRIRAIPDTPDEPDNPTPNNPTSGSHSHSTPYDDVDSDSAFIKFGAIAGLFCLGLMCFIPFSKKKKNKK